MVKMGVMCMRAGDSQLAEPEGGRAAAHGAKRLAVPKPGLTSPFGTQQLLVFPQLAPHFLVFSPLCVLWQCDALHARPRGGGHVSQLQDLSLAPSTHGG